MSENSSNHIYCQNCGCYIGYYIEHNGQVWISIGNAILYSAHGHCARCGEGYHFWSSEKQLEKLLYRLTKKSLSVKIETVEG